MVTKPDNDRSDHVTHFTPMFNGGFRTGQAGQMSRGLNNQGASTFYILVF